MEVDPDPVRLNNLRVVVSSVDGEAPLKQTIKLPFEMIDQVLDEGMLYFQDGDNGHFVKLVYGGKLKSKVSVFTQEVVKQSRLIVSPPTRRQNAPAPGHVIHNNFHHHHHQGPNPNNHHRAAPKTIMLQIIRIVVRSLLIKTRDHSVSRVFTTI